MVMDLKSGLGPLWLIYFISILFFFSYPEVGCVWVEGAAGLQRSQQKAGMDGDGGGASLFFLLQSGFPQSSGYTSGSPTAIPGTAPGSPWALEFM